MKIKINLPSRFGRKSVAPHVQLIVRRVFLWAVVGLLAAHVARAAQTQCSVTVKALDWGWYDTNGLRGSNAYVVGQIPGSTSAPPAQLRDFFVFNVPSFTGTLTSASLEIDVDGFNTPDSSEVFEL